MKLAVVHFQQEPGDKEVGECLAASYLIERHPSKT